MYRTSLLLQYPVDVDHFPFDRQVTSKLPAVSKPPLQLADLVSPYENSWLKFCVFKTPVSLGQCTTV